MHKVWIWRAMEDFDYSTISAAQCLSSRISTLVFNVFFFNICLSYVGTRVCWSQPIWYKYSTHKHDF